MAEDRTVELAHFVAVVILRDTDRAERPTIYAAANAIARSDRAATRFGHAIAASLVSELQGVQVLSPHFLFSDPPKEKP